MHTTHTDGSASVQQMAEAAASMRMDEILFSEHVRHTSTYYPEFVAEVRKIAPNAAGSPVTILEAGRVVVEALVQAALWACLGIGALVIAINRSAKEILLIF